MLESAFSCTAVLISPVLLRYLQSPEPFPCSFNQPFPGLLPAPASLCVPSPPLEISPGCKVIAKWTALLCGDNSARERSGHKPSSG